MIKAGQVSATMDLRRPSSKSDYHKTPNMDAILERGMRFSNGYAAAPVCSPTATVYNLENHPHD